MGDMVLPLDMDLLTDMVLPTASAMELLPTPVLPPPSLPGLPRVSTVSSATTARGAPMPTTATDMVLPTDTALESPTTTSTPATTATTTPTVCPDAPSLP